MKPVFQLTINRENLTEALKDRVTSIKVEDAAGYENDNLIIDIDGRSPFPKFPKEGAIIEVSFGYEEMKDVFTRIPLTKIGTYELAEVDWEGPPWKLTLTANAMSMLKFPKTARNDTHEKTTLKAIVEKCAKRMGYTPDVHPSFASVSIDYESQKNQTDMEFINALAQRHGAFPKVYNQRLRFHPKSGANFVDERLLVGQVFPGSVNYHSAVRGVYGSIQAVTFSYDTATLTRVDVDPSAEELTDAPAVMELSKLYDTVAKARAAVDSKKQFLSAEKDTFSCKVGGNPFFVSHRKLTLFGDEWHPDIPKDWIIVSSKHEWKKGSGDGAGYSTEIKCEVLTEGQSDSDNDQNDLDPSIVGEETA